MNKHTPGPWSVLDEQRGFIITARDGCYDVAVVRNIGNADNAANARLIAAAPDLLQALIEIRDNGTSWDAAYDELIAKATGA